MLKAIDRIGVFDRSTGLSPFLLLDGHGSRFELSFLEYINDANHKWWVCLGLPYGTSIWQVGDSTEQNGCYKMALIDEKMKLVTQKNDAGLPYSILKTDIIPLVRKAWAVSFARKETNIKAINARGWGPRGLNKNCLTHPEVLATKPKAHGNNPISADVCAGASILGPDNLNLTEGLAGTLTDRLVAYKNENDRRMGVNREEITAKKRETATAAINKNKRLTAGLLVCSGSFHLGPEVLRKIKEREIEQQGQLAERERKTREAYDKHFAEVQAIKALQQLPEQWSSSQLKVMVKWYKQDSDAAIPSKKQELLTRYLETCSREGRVA
eukprot:CAMPEP_0172416928 /NCGR_PEP_ID=MMETSP1064-20121228/3436_1 /TAXON_ID=202472 /ORGANISM="Aulacoseira subarctica , Strain CCAP 1002/5" /LENGTH=325 /DNA_ID=CAMNT_0013154913 /DNA_START=569 /DNA_END=1542 /DNA_ORIENTATION=+